MYDNEFKRIRGVCLCDYLFSLTVLYIFTVSSNQEQLFILHTTNNITLFIIKSLILCLLYLIIFCNINNIINSIIYSSQTIDNSVLQLSALSICMTQTVTYGTGKPKTENRRKPHVSGFRLFFNRSTQWGRENGKPKTSCFGFRVSDLHATNGNENRKPKTENRKFLTTKMLGKQQVILDSKVKLLNRINSLKDKSVIVILNTNFNIIHIIYKY